MKVDRNKIVRKLGGLGKDHSVIDGVAQIMLEEKVNVDRAIEIYKRQEL